MNEVITFLLSACRLCRCQRINIAQVRVDTDDPGLCFVPEGMGMGMWGGGEVNAEKGGWVRDMDAEIEHSDVC